MIKPLVRSILFAGVFRGVGPRRLTQIELKLGGRKALSARTHMAHRSLMAFAFQGMKAIRSARAMRRKS